MSFSRYSPERGKLIRMNDYENRARAANSTGALLMVGTALTIGILGIGWIRTVIVCAAIVGMVFSVWLIYKLFYAFFSWRNHG